MPMRRKTHEDVRAWKRCIRCTVASRRQTWTSLYALMKSSELVEVCRTSKRKECSPCVELQNPGPVPHANVQERKNNSRNVPHPIHPYWRVLPISPTSTWTTRIEGKSKNRVSVDNKTCDTTKRRSRNEKYRWSSYTAIAMKLKLSTNWMRTTLNGEWWKSRIALCLKLPNGIPSRSL